MFVLRPCETESAAAFGLHSHLDLIDADGDGLLEGESAARALQRNFVERNLRERGQVQVCDLHPAEAAYVLQYPRVLWNLHLAREPEVICQMDGRHWLNLGSDFR